MDHKDLSRGLRLKDKLIIYVLLSFPVLLVGIPFNCQSQVVLAVSAGVNCSDLPKRNSLPNGSEKISPVISPLLTLSAIVKSQRRGSLIVAMAYTRVGQKYSINRAGFDILNQQNYTITADEALRLNQVSFPIALEYALSLKTIEIGVILGVTPVYFVEGDYSYSYTLENDAASYYSIVKEYDPFSSATLAENASRFNSEFLLGVSFHLMRSWSLRMDYSMLLQEVSFREYPPPGAIWDDPSYEHSYGRGNIQFSVQYALWK
jgi:hypothetical protein